MEGFIQGEPKDCSAPKFVKLEVVVSKEQYAKLKSQLETNEVVLSVKHYNEGELAEFEQQYKEYLKENGG